MSIYVQNTNVKLKNFKLNKILEFIFIFIYVMEIIFSSKLFETDQIFVILKN